jgi:dipeptidyl aminopeptidase/acylaminoacyl peptidase
VCQAAPHLPPATGLTQAGPLYSLRQLPERKPLVRMTAMKMLGFCALALILCAPAQAQSAQPRGLELEDLRAVVGVAQPAISPDGRSVVYLRSKLDFKNDRTDRELVLVDVPSGVERTLTHDRVGVSAPAWSRDGRFLAYLASPERGKPAQVYVLPMNGGDSLKLTGSPTGVDAFAWRPDGRAIAYTREDEPADKAQIDKHLDAVTVTDQDYLTLKAAQPLHLWTINADGSGDKRLTSGPWSLVAGASILWSRDGTKIYYQRQPDPIFAHFVSQQVWEHDLVSGADAPILHEVASYPQISNDGSMLAVVLPRHGSVYLQQDVSVRSLADRRELFSSRAIDRNVHWYDWMPDNKRLLMGASDGIRNVAWFLNADGTSRKLDLGDVDFGADASIAGNGTIAFIGEKSNALPELYVLAPNTTAPKRLTDENHWLASFRLARVDAFSWQTDLGVAATGVLVYPLDYTSGKKYPLVLDIHGGPVSTSVRDLAGLEAPFDQVLAKRGYFVFRPNYRGSDNQGDAFLQAIVGDVSSGPGRDNLAAVDALRRTGMIDESRIFVSGWSGGGLQTSWLIGHANFWRAAVSGAAVDDWYQQAVLADINENFAQTFFAGATPFTKDGRSRYAAESPITYVSAIKTPTLILSDTRDQRVPVSQSFIFYHALLQRGVPVQFTVFPRYGHFSSDPVGREITLRAWGAWFDRWMK